MAEQITVHGDAGRIDRDGNRVPGRPGRTIHVKSVQPITLDEINEDDRQGITDALKVWAMPGADVGPGDMVTIRGLRYRVVTTAWDWSKHRRPALARHRPGVVFDCVRGAG